MHLEPVHLLESTTWRQLAFCITIDDVIMRISAGKGVWAWQQRIVKPIFGFSYVFSGLICIAKIYGYTLYMLRYTLQLLKYASKHGLTAARD